MEIEGNDDNSLAIIHSQWLTPRKGEVLWPPVKTQDNFNKLLRKGEHSTEKWNIYKIRKILFITGKQNNINLHINIVFIAVL